MHYIDFSQQLKKQLSKIDTNQQAKLALVICKKLLPDYQNFFEIHNWGNPDVLSNIVSLIEQSLKNPVEYKIITEGIQLLETITPDTDDFDDTKCSYALNTCIAIQETLSFILSQDTTHIYNVCITYTDTIDFKIQEEGELSEEEINTHPLMAETRNFLLLETL